MMVEGVGVQGQDKRGEWTGSKECKVGGIIHQSGSQLQEMACFCTWERITGFRSLVEKRNDTLVKNRMVRQKRMRWSQSGGEAMMQVLAAQMNGRFDELFA